MSGVHMGATISRAKRGSRLCSRTEVETKASSSHGNVNEACFYAPRRLALSNDHYHDHDDDDNHDHDHDHARDHDHDHDHDADNDH